MDKVSDSNGCEREEGREEGSVYINQIDSLLQ